MFTESWNLRIVLNRILGQFASTRNHTGFKSREKGKHEEASDKQKSSTGRFSPLKEKDYRGDGGFVRDGL